MKGLVTKLFHLSFSVIIMNVKTSEERIILQNSALIICSKDRQADLETTLGNIYKSQWLPGIIIIVDSSSDKLKTIRAVENLHTRENLNLVVLSSNYGLPHQRNVGLSYLLSQQRLDEIACIFFLDDDIDVGVTFFIDAANFLMSEPDLLAIGGCESSTRPTRVTMFRRLFLGEPRGPAQIGPSGLVTVADCKEKLVEADWIPGGAMIIKAKVFDSFRFDGTRRMFGEDVEASIRLAKKGKIAVYSHLDYRHRKVDSGKVSSREASYFSDAFRLELTYLLPMKVKRSRVILASLSLMLWDFIRGKQDSSLGHLDFIRDVSTNKKIKRDIVNWGWENIDDEQLGSHKLLIRK